MRGSWVSRRRLLSRKRQPSSARKTRRTIFPTEPSFLPQKGHRGEVPEYGEQCSPADLILRTLPSDTGQPWPQSPKRTSRDHKRSGKHGGSHFSGGRSHISGKHDDASLNGLLLKNTQEPRRLGISGAQRTCSKNDKLPHRFDTHTFLFWEEHKDLVGWIVTSRSIEIHFVTTCASI